MTSKTSQKEAAAAGFAAFDAAKAGEQFRAFAEKSTEQTREFYARMKTGAEDAQSALETTFENAKSTGNEFAAKSIAAMREGAEANLAHLEALAGARSLADIIELQGSFLRKRLEVAADQIRDFQISSQKSAEVLAKPMKEAFEKAFKDMRAA